MSLRIAKSKSVENLLLVAGLTLTGFAVSCYVGGRIYSQAAVARFHSTSKPQGARIAGAARSVAEADASVDYALWSPVRIEQYKRSLAEHFDDPHAVLKVEKIHLEVPVFEGTSDLVLDRGVGHISGTAQVGESGNVGIAGHRDGFFRGLKDVSVGDRIELETISGTYIYVIDRITLVKPDDLSVLRNGSAPELTLVTCYPFYFVGSAPLRYIIHASLNSGSKAPNEPAKASLQTTASRTKENTQ